MRRFIKMAVMSFMILAVLVLAACSEKQDLTDSKYLGTWKAVAMEMGEASEETDFDFEITLKDDGTGIMIGGDVEESKFTWSLTDNGFKTKGDMKLTFRDVEDNKIAAKILGADLVFEKQK